MADQETTAEAAEPAAAAPAKKSSALLKIGIPIFIGVVILAECIFAYMLIPSSKEIEAEASKVIEEDLEKAAEEAEGKTSEEEDALAIEVELGSYNVTSHKPATNTTLRIDFKLYGTVLEDEQSEFQTLFDNNQHRLRDTIIFEMRNSELTDLTDPGLGLIKRRILEKSNALFGKPVLKEIIFSEFSFFGQ